MTFRFYQYQISSLPLQLFLLNMSIHIYRIRLLVLFLFHLSSSFCFIFLSLLSFPILFVMLPTTCMSFIVLFLSVGNYVLQSLFFLISRLVFVPSPLILISCLFVLEFIVKIQIIISLIV